jgi:hypothetical protein
MNTNLASSPAKSHSLPESDGERPAPQQKKAASKKRNGLCLDGGAVRQVKISRRRKLFPPNDVVPFGSDPNSSRGSNRRCR